MKDLDLLVKDALKPFLPNENKNQSTSQQQRFALFDEKSDALLHREWVFAMPRARPSTSVHIERVVKSASISLSNEEYDALVYLSKAIDSLKERVDTESHNTRYLLVYAKLINILDCVFENNSEPYGYYVENNGDTRYLLSASFLVEHLHVLLRLVSHYTHDNKAERIALAIDALREIYALCEEALKDEPSKSKIRYITAPSSISNTTSSSSTKTSEVGFIGVREFIQHCLGGMNAISARLHLCEAKRYETLYQSDDKTQIDAIQHAYEDAHKEAERGSKFWHYTRFMAHLWRCRRHFTLAKAESAHFLVALTNAIESDAERESARETLARLLYVLSEVTRFEHDGSDTLALLDTALAQEYNALVRETSLLTKTIDLEIYGKRRMKEKTGIVFEHEPATTSKEEEDEHSPCLRELRQSAFKKYCLAHPNVDKSLVIVRRLYETRRETPVPIVATKPESGVTHLDNMARLAILEEREPWLRWIISRYSLSDAEFIISGDLYQRFVDELREVEKTKALYGK